MQEVNTMANYEQMSEHELSDKVCKLIDGKENINYCRSWAYAGPIIEEYGTSLRYCAIYNKWEACTYTSIGSVYYNVHDKNPLRAAMICFIKMKDAEKNDGLI